MTEPKGMHTSGPLEILGRVQDLHIHNFYAIGQAKGTHPGHGIATAYVVQKEDAELYAVAPDLLAEAIELLRNAVYGDGTVTVLTRDCEALEAAIRKVGPKGI